jgi:fatty-acyl-CoA synthase
MATASAPPNARGWLPLGDVLLADAEHARDRDALVFPAERMSYGELADRALSLARAFLAMGVRRGDRIGILMANSPDFVVTLFGIVLAGAVAVPINIRFRSAELPYVVTDAGLVGVVTSDRIDDYVNLFDRLVDALATASAQAAPWVALLGDRVVAGAIGETELRAAAGSIAPAELARRRAHVRLRDPAVMLYTSGTTSQPRGCALTHKALVRNWDAVADVLELGPADRCWAPGPLFHLGALGPLLACVTRGAAFLTDTYFRADTSLAFVARERPTVLYPANPPVTQALLDEATFADHDLSAARLIVNIGTPEALRRIQAAFPSTTQLSLYGLTEAGGAVAYSRPRDPLDARLETCGTPLPGAELRAVDPDTGADRAPGEVGEILVRSVSLCEGYWNDPDETARRFGADGWLHTGDLGSIDPDNRLRFRGRMKEMLKVGGENVGPAEIEGVLSAHEAVKIAQVVGIPDKRLEEVPAAFVELKTGCTATEPELIAYCSERIARFKVPRHVRIVTEWPLSATKIQKEPLRRGLLADLGLEP